MDTLSSRIKEEACKLTRQHGDIDVIVCRDDFTELESEVSVLSSLILDYFLGKNRHCFAVVRFRGNSVDVDKIEVETSGAGHVKLNVSNVGSITGEVSGVGDVDVTGSAESFNVKVSGVGSASGPNIQKRKK